MTRFHDKISLDKDLDKEIDHEKDSTDYYCFVFYDFFSQRLFFSP